MGRRGVISGGGIVWLMMVMGWGLLAEESTQMVAVHCVAERGIVNGDITSAADRGPMTARRLVPGVCSVTFRDLGIEAVVDLAASAGLTEWILAA